jgi:biopolymer transport protein ExbD
MKSARFVCLIAFSLLANAAAQTPAMTKGVSVQMAQTNNAAAYPDADNANAWIIAVTADGRLFFGVKPVTPDQLFEEMKITPRNRNAKLYVKADARSPFSALKGALGVARSAWFENAVLLTSQPAAASSSGLVPPQGIDVRIVPQKAGTIDVRLSRQGETSIPIVNGKASDWSELEGTLKALVGKADQTVNLEATDAVPFADLMRVIDEARMAGATVAVPMYHSL